ncbi:hypothetical protein K461DRAFT_273709 [Myriangium duriaei CBS 260.36]|uniref:Uncharacterized protein n=1 Tax=Myriangium duriaei CBS 260.36 TaxID=1168546 RepID=A0A9P4JES0_9PEZI|nr:hypothetical protein K461DRAFT_273709 [Myriangium duriaei CBS 260.36]
MFLFLVAVNLPSPEAIRIHLLPTHTNAGHVPPTRQIECKPSFVRRTIQSCSSASLRMTLLPEGRLSESSHENALYSSVPHSSGLL